VHPVVPEDERIWVPRRGTGLPSVAPAHRQGYWCNLLRVRRTGIVSRHRHPMPVTGYVIKGRWHYLEHDWMAEPGAFLFEPPGETHTLVVPEGETEMITLFTVNAAMIYVDPWGRPPAMRTYSPRSTCAASTTPRSDWAPTTSTSSSGERDGVPLSGRRALVTGGRAGSGWR